VQIRLANDRVAALHEALGQAETRHSEETIVGTIDGTRRFTGTMWFQPDQSGRPIIASVTDVKMLERVNAINARPNTRVRARFIRSEVFSSAPSSSRSRTSHLLIGIEELAPDTPLDPPSQAVF
jgi:hypothetical protein